MDDTGKRVKEYFHSVYGDSVVFVKEAGPLLEKAEINYKQVGDLLLAPKREVLQRFPELKEKVKQYLESMRRTTPSHGNDNGRNKTTIYGTHRERINTVLIQTTPEKQGSRNNPPIISNTFRVNTNRINTFCINLSREDTREILEQLKTNPRRETTSFRIDRRVLDKTYEILVKNGIPTKKLGHLIELLLLKWIDNIESEQEQHEGGEG